jgi:hypothetical protein
MPKSKLPPEVLKFFQDAGRVGGKLAAERMSRQQRINRAKAAGKASGRARDGGRRKSNG